MILSVLSLDQTGFPMKNVLVVMLTLTRIVNMEHHKIGSDT
jgi:hypothetical protein